MKLKKVLIVDDEADLRDVMAFNIEDAGFQTFKASSGRDALKILSKENIDIIISDLRMPDGDGIFLLNQLKSTLIKIPVVFFVSAFSDITEDDARSLGAKALLKKPIDPAALIKQINEVI